MMEGRTRVINHCLTVLSVGYLARPMMQGHHCLAVHSVFSRAVNLSLANGGLLTLLNNEYQNLPCAVRIAAPAGWDWRNYCHRSMHITIQQGRLIGGDWQADSTRASNWQPAKLSMSSEVDRQMIGNHHHVLKTLLMDYCQQHQVSSALQLLPDEPTDGRLPSLALAHSDSQLQQQVAGLIGYGSGLTPDGDDYLLGYLAALSLWHQHPTLSRHINSVKAAIAQMLTKTTDISKHYLSLALQQDYSEPVYRLLGCLCRQTTEQELKLAGHQVMQFGAASGVDCLAGVLHGLRTVRSVH
ncbi:DUF2877 domain-containing protein [Budviciaceae bacterium BWR-B9]|uniref:DUF2877 domain-containing protein n=1 Tax=Limnobaculum allomyrinae TaxID=2791986 RepID=A0ABS1IS18_9GAMM|nr:MULTISPECIES: DUF2877 domain-containing protein [Limnobaculum]MBK5144558.1 DUF2877 domain-containing protein [Limnobaculum allomyrinae]MBV7692213.1 DUF2877 domain-containing protein [Limnobaculum sp. M2-1]